MLNAYEQKALIEYLINAVEFMKNDPNSSFCLEKVTGLVKTVQNSHKIKQIYFNLKENADYYNSIKEPKMLYRTVADDIIAQLKKQYKDAIQTLKDEKKELEKLVTFKNWILHPADYYDAKKKIEDINKQIEEIEHSQNQVTVGYEIANNKVGEAIPLTENMKTVLQQASDKAKVFSETTTNWKENIRNANIDAGKFKGTLSTGFNVPLKFNTDTTSFDLVKSILISFE